MFFSVETHVWTCVKIIRFWASFCSLVSSKKSLPSSTKKKKKKETYCDSSTV